MKCTHPMTWAEIRYCSLTFGNCWINPPKTQKTKEKVNNQPNGFSFDKERMNPRKA